MDYYERKTRAIRMIETLYKQGHSERIVKISIMRSYGLSGKFVDDILDLLEPTKEEQKTKSDKNGK